MECRLNDDDEKLKLYASRYRFLAYCQETVGVKVLPDMPSGKKHDQLYWQCKQWVEGEDVDI